MAQKIVVYDDSAGKTVASATLIGAVGGGFTDQDYDVGGGGQTDFVFSAGFGAGQKIDVYANGRLLRSGGSYDYTSNATTDTITFNTAVPQGWWVRVRVWG